MTIKLKDHISPESEELTVWQEFRHGFKVKIRYLSRKRLQHIFKLSTRKGWDRDHRPIEELDNQKLIKYLAEVIEDWEGLTPEVLATLLPIDVAAAKKALKEKGLQEIPCTEENKITLLEEAYHFDEFIREVALDAQLFTFARQKEAEAKNSSSSSGGGKRPEA